MRLGTITMLALLAGGAGLVAAQPQGSVEAGSVRPEIAIHGHVTGLHPGGSKWMRLRLHNRSRRDLIVTEIRARALDPAGRCAPRALTTGPRRVRRLVPGRSSVVVRYRIGMAADAANVCQGRRFPLRYRAEVRR